MTFTQLKTKVGDYCTLTSAEAMTRVGNSINAHYRRVTSLLGMDTTRFVTRSASTTDGVRTMTFTGIEKIDRIIDVTGDVRLLAEVSMHDLRSINPAEGQPSKWAVQSTGPDSVTVVFDTIPDAAYSLQADGTTSLSDLSGSDEPAFPESFHDILAWFTIAEELLKKEKDKLAATYEAKAEKLLSDLRFKLADSPTKEFRQRGTEVHTLTGGSTGSAVSESLAFLQAGTGAVLRTVQAKLRERISVEDFNAAGDDTTDDHDAIERAMTYANSLGGGIVCLTHGKTYRVVVGATDTGVLVPDYVTLDGQGATIRFEMSGACFGVRLMNFSQVVNVTIEVDSQDGLDDTYQSIYQSNISVGEQYGANGTVAAPSEHEGVHHWRAADIILETNRVMGAMVVVYGGANHGVFERMHLVGNDVTRIGFGFDPGWLGDLQSNESNQNKTNYNAGTMFTTHPQNIVIRDCKIGALTNTDFTVEAIGSVGVRLSGCHHITVDNVRMEGCTSYGVWHTGSDIGIEYARADDRKLGYKGMRFTNVVLLPGVACQYGAFVDVYGDNTWRDQYTDEAYELMVPQPYEADIVFEQCQFIGTDAAESWGVRVASGSGVTVRNSDIRLWETGVWFDEHTRECVVEDSNIEANRLNGVLLGFSLRESCDDCRVEGNIIHGNGTAGTASGIVVARGSRHRLLDNMLGKAGEADQARGITIDGAGLVYNCQIVGNHVRGVTTSAYVLESSSPPAPARNHAIGVFRDNSSALNQTQVIGGLTCIPAQMQTIGEHQLREFLSNETVVPTEGTWYRGDRIRRSDASASTSPGWDVVTSGTFGTLAGLTNASTTDTSAVVEMSLQSKTADTTQSSYTITLNNATNIRKGLKVTIADAGIENATIVSLSGTTATLDVQAKSTETGATLVTAGVLIGEVVSLNTTPAISGAVVKAIDDNSVTLSVAASSTETGRTATYTVPVFKTHAALGA